MRKSLVFAAALVGAASLPFAASHAGDTAGNISQNLDTYGPSGSAPNGANTELNPQPLPPGLKSPYQGTGPNSQTSTSGNKIDPAATGQHIPKAELNPQPLPPGMQSPYQGELNPQPLPPGRTAQ